MTFKKAVGQTPHLESAWCTGLQALRPEDREKVRPAHPKQLRGSADIDAALTQRHPNANRWDFAIAFQPKGNAADKVYWVEFHTGSDHGAIEVLRKLTWLTAWLAGEGILLAAFEREFVWVSSGKVSINPNSPQARGIALGGLSWPRRILHIP